MSLLLGDLHDLVPERCLRGAARGAGRAPLEDLVTIDGPDSHGRAPSRTIAAMSPHEQPAGARVRAAIWQARASIGSVGPAPDGAGQSVPTCGPPQP